MTLNICLLAQSGYFEPFNSHSRKAYVASNSPDRIYSLTFDSTSVVGTDSVYWHFGQLNEGSLNISLDCPGWGPPYCFPTDLPEWSGSLFRNNGHGNYDLRNSAGDTLHFHFALGPGDTSAFFQDQSQRFAIVLESLDTATVLGIQDSVRTYRIMHTDLSGTVIPSLLNDQPLCIGKVLGLVNFFQIDLFPEVLRPLEMIGNKNPDTGFHQITDAMLYDFQPGDMVQTRSTFYQPGGPPYNNYDVYATTFYLDRTDTPDSVIYAVDLESFSAITGAHSTGSSIRKYSKNHVLWEIPFERFSNGYHHNLHLADHCGLALWTMEYSPALYLAYCAEGNCWGSFDSNGPLPDEHHVEVLGLGTYLSSSILSYPQPSGFSSTHSIPYFMKNGVECGTEHTVGIDELETPPTMLIFPNPGQTTVQIRSLQPLVRLRLFSSVGTMALDLIPAADGLLDISGLASGTYLMDASLIGGGKAHRVFIKE